MPESLTLSQKTATIQVGATKEITAVIEPSDAVQTLTWTSSDEGVATVENGLITANETGSATIAATTVNGITAEVSVTVPEPTK